MERSNEVIEGLSGALTALTRVVHDINEANGWNEKRTVGEDIALITSECSEALEAYRECGDATKRWYTHTYETPNGLTLKNLTEHQVYGLVSTAGPNWTKSKPKPEGVGAELADVIIRVLHTADMHGIDIAAEVAEKIVHNSTRGHRHGGKYL